MECIKFYNESTQHLLWQTKLKSMDKRDQKENSNEEASRGGATFSVKRRKTATTQDFYLIEDNKIRHLKTQIDNLNVPGDQTD